MRIRQKRAGALAAFAVIAGLSFNPWDSQGEEKRPNDIFDCMSAQPDPNNFGRFIAQIDKTCVRKLAQPQKEDVQTAALKLKF